MICCVLRLVCVNCRKSVGGRRFRLGVTLPMWPMRCGSAWARAQRRGSERRIWAGVFGGRCRLVPTVERTGGCWRRWRVSRRGEIVGAPCTLEEIVSVA